MSFSFLQLFSAEIQGLILFIFGLIRRDHLLLGTLKHKLADPLVAARSKRIAEGGSYGGVPELMYRGCIGEPSGPSPRGWISPPPIMASQLNQGKGLLCLLYNQTPGAFNIWVFYELFGGEMIFLKYQLQLHSTLMIREEGMALSFGL